MQLRHSTLLLYVYYNVMMTKNITFNSSTYYVYYAAVMTKNIKINSSTMFTIP